MHIYAYADSSRHAETYYVRLYYKVFKRNFYEPTDTRKGFSVYL